MIYVNIEIHQNLLRKHIRYYIFMNVYFTKILVIKKRLALTFNLYISLDCKVYYSEWRNRLSIVYIRNMRVLSNEIWVAYA